MLFVYCLYTVPLLRVFGIASRDRVLVAQRQEIKQFSHLVQCVHVILKCFVYHTCTHNNNFHFHFITNTQYTCIQVTCIVVLLHFSVALKINNTLTIFTNNYIYRPDFLVCTTAPPSSNSVTFSIVTSSTTFGPVTNIYDVF